MMSIVVSFKALIDEFLMLGKKDAIAEGQGVNSYFIFTLH